MAYTPRQAQLVTAAYQKYLHRTPSSSEIQAQVDEAASRGENEQQWQQRIDQHFASQAKPAPTSAPAPTSKAATPDPNFAGFTTFKGGPPDSYDLTGFNPAPTLEQVNQNDAIRAQSLQNAKIIPGATPILGVLPSGTVIDLRSGLPAKDVSPVDQAYAKLAQSNANTPKYWDVKDKIELAGRGYTYEGSPSQEEQALEARLLAGDKSAAGPLANMRMKRLQVTPKPGIDPIMKAITLAGIGTGFGAMLGPLMGPVLAPMVSGGLTSTLSSGGDWQKIVASTLAGGAGALAGPLASGAAGGGIAGGLAGGAAGGAASAATRYGLSEAFGGTGNPWDVAVSGLSGAAAGGLGSALNTGSTSIGSDPGGIGDFQIPPSGWEKFLNSLSAKGAGASVSQLAGAIAPGDPSSFGSREGPGSPFLSQNEMAPYRNAAAEQARTELRARMDEYNAKYADAKAAWEAKKAEAQAAYDAAKGSYEQKLAAYNAKIAEYNAKATEYKTKQQEAMDRLHAEALGYLEKVNAQRLAPLPPVTGAPDKGPLAPLFGITRPTTGDFDPSSAVKSQTFAGDFPVTGTSFSESPNPAPETAAVASQSTPKTDMKRLPLNLMQIQAALSSRRRG